MKSGAPIIASSFATCCVTDDWVTPSAAAARVKLRWRAAMVKAVS
ncbi:MAG: hypothetical protein AAFN79_11805 [Pseudomonadota bacterium]